MKRCETQIAGDHDEAIAKAKRLIADRDVEVWSGERFVIRSEHKPE
ncbi:hypothetical protein [Bradyrhizobium sp.]|jgi:hypothetical protein|nr:hypothetical protein [Bradyrhizobium sp.]